MADPTTIDRLESRLTNLIDGILARKAGQADFLIGLNRLDDILIEHQQGRPITDLVLRFLADYEYWIQPDILNKPQRRRLGDFLVILHQALLDTNNADSLKLAEEVKTWLRTIGDGSFRLTLKRSAEQVPLSDRFISLITRESKELGMLLEQHDHLLTCLDDVLKSAETKTDAMYRHLAASIIYFLQMEGYKADPYIKRLRQIRDET